MHPTRLSKEAVILSGIAAFLSLHPSKLPALEFPGDGVLQLAQAQVEPDRSRPQPRERKPVDAKRPKLVDARNVDTGKPKPERDPELAQYARYAADAPKAPEAPPVETRLPLELRKGERICLIGNTLLDRAADFGFIEALIQQRHPGQGLVVRNLAWSADEITLQPRPDNFANLEQQLTFEKADVILAAFGFNESFGGEEGLPIFRENLTRFLQRLKTRAFNGKTAARVILLSPIANENLPDIPAADLNDERLALYTGAMREVANETGTAFIDVFHPTRELFAQTAQALTFNGIHLEEEGYRRFAEILHRGLFEETAPEVDEALRAAVREKNTQYFRRYRPLNTFYYTGGRRASYGYLDFLPAMRNFDIMVANRDQRIWDLAQGKPVPARIDDSNVPEMPETSQSRGANEWLSPAEEQASFEVDPRFEVNLFASEEQFPDIACPIQMRWDARGRLWVSCSTTYPHVYPGREPEDKIVILEDTDQDGRADKSTVWADDVHIPLSFEFGDGGVYVSEEPHFSFLKDTDGDGKADFRRRVLTGFGCEDSHHALHDFVWTPDGDLMFRESIFHHSQVETPYGPIRAENSAWFLFKPRNQRLWSFGNYPNTNPWGVTFDDWGHHVASHPIFASAFHALNPPYPDQHPKATGIPAYSGVCGHEFVDFPFWPEELKGGFIKVRYKPSNRVEIHRWIEEDDHFREEYQGDLLFSRNLSFIPVDLRYGPRGAMYVCDWYNPIKGHAQYSLRDTRRDRKSGRIWRIVPKGATLPPAPAIAGESIPALLDLLKRPEYRHRYRVRRELRERDPAAVATALDAWVTSLDPRDPRHRHHQLEAVWAYRNVNAVRPELLRELLKCDHHQARAGATQQLRWWHDSMPDAIELLRRSANDPSGLVRLEAANAASYIGTREALDAMLDIARYPRDTHLAYAFTCALGSAPLQRHWKDNPAYAQVPALLKVNEKSSEFVETVRSAQDAEFDTRKNLTQVRISCIPERMMFTLDRFDVPAGQPVKLVFTNPDATDHNLVITRPGAMEEVGVAANDMARDPKYAQSDFIPASRKNLILHHTPLIGPTRKAKLHVLRFEAPTEPGLYPYVCTFPGHWVIMNGLMVVTNVTRTAEALLAERESPQFVRDWKMADFTEADMALRDTDPMRGMAAFAKANCHQCHQAHGHGIPLGPDLSKIHEKYQGLELLRQILEPSAVIDDAYRVVQLKLKNGEDQTGVIVEENDRTLRLRPSLLLPDQVLTLTKKQVVSREASRLSPMPEGMVSTLTRGEILDLLKFLQTGHAH